MNMLSRGLTAAIALGLLASGAQASIPDTSRKVAVADLDLGSEAGKALLRRRVEVAAVAVCRRQVSTADRSLGAQEAFDACRRLAEARALAAASATGR